MSAYNKAILIGRLTRDPEMRYTKTGKPVVSFTLAINRRTSNQQEKQADFINIVAWQKLAEICANYLTKGSLVAVDGRIQTRSYDAQDGQKKYVFEVIAENMQMLERRTDAGTKAGAKEEKTADNEIPFDENLADEIFSEEVPF